MSYYEFETEVFWWRVELFDEFIKLSRTDILGSEESFNVEIDAVLPITRGLLAEYERATMGDQDE